MPSSPSEIPPVSFPLSSSAPPIVSNALVLPTPSSPSPSPHPSHRPSPPYSLSPSPPPYSSPRPTSPRKSSPPASPPPASPPPYPSPRPTAPRKSSPPASPPPASPPPPSPPPPSPPPQTSSPPVSPKHPSPKPPLRSASPVSEAMRRLQDMLKAGKLSTSSPITFPYKSYVFEADLLPDGSLRSRPLSNETPSNLPTPSFTSGAIYSSPSHFALDMAAAVIALDGTPVPNPRAKLSINGWQSCMMEQRSLEVLRRQMLTERKCQVSALPPSLPQLPHHTSSHPQLSISPAHNRQPVSNPSISPCRDAPHHVRPDAKPDTAAKSHTDGEPNKPEIENKRKQCQNPPFTDNIHSTHMTSDSVPPSPSNNNCPGKDTLSLPPAMSTANNDLSNALDANKPTSTSLESHYKKDHLLIQPPVQPSSPPSSHAQDMRSRSTAAKERKAAQQLQQQILGDSASELDIAPVEKKKERTQKSKKRSASPTKGNNKKRKRTENNQLSPSDSIVEARRSPSVAKEPRTQKAKKNSVSPAKAHGKKEKRSESGGSTPSRLPGRVSKSKESSRSRKSQVPSASQVQVRDLDPEAMEAAAVAAQAEKEEASRARRTTRLAAGKIKLVDYKSSANPHSSRALSPDGELDENDINNENAAADPPRTSRRRAAHNQSSVPQRSSRRVAKLKEKGQSSEDVENSVGRSSSAGNGSDDKGGANVDDMEIDIAVPSRANGTRDRKRTRESASKRSRHNTTEDGDYAYSKAYGTRASTRENSVIDAGEATDIGDANEFDVDEDVEAEEKLEDRTDLHGFTLADLTCIGFAVKSADSTDGSDVVSELEKQEEWGRDDGKDNKVYAYLKYLITGIEDFCKSLDIEREDEVSVEEALSFIATDCNRLRNGGLDTGMPRNVKGILKKVSAEMQHKNALERQRRKESRELEEMRHTLEKEMEMTRKSEMELSMAEVSVCEVRRALATEKARSWHVKKEIEKYKRMEADAKSRVEKAKLLFNQLRHEKHGPESGAGEGADDGKKGCLEKDERQGEKKEGEEGRALDESLTSNDDDATNKTPTVWTKRQLEMDRLRSLIAAREAEAEAFQREAEQERMKFLTALEIKNRLETELYMAGKPQSPPAQGAGNAGHASGSGGKTTREAGCSKKGDGRSGRGKNGAKSGNGGGPSHAGARVNGSNKGKSGGKNGESSKGTKRKSSKSQSAAEK